MALSLSPDRLKRYKDLLVLLIKHGSTARFDADEASPETQKHAEAFARDLEALGPTFIKLGQLLSTRPDFLSRPYLRALARLQDNVAPFPFATVEEIVSAELGARLSKAFSEFDEEPVAAASLGQVHRAHLRDGRLVAVKVQRPGIRETILQDLDALRDIAGSIERYTDVGRRFAFVEMLEEFRKTLLRELDYTMEAQNLVRLGENLRSYERIIVPQPIDDYTTSHVLTMDYVRGTKITSFSPLARLEMNGAELAGDLFRAYLDQVLIDGFFHADPHPGNVFLTDDHRIALIDLGMVARVDPEMREHLLKLLLYISEGRGTEAAEISLALGVKLHDFNQQAYTMQASDFVARYQDATLEQMNVGSIMLELTRIAAGNGLRSSPQLTMLGKTLLNLDEIGRTLEPTFDPQAVIRQHANSILQRHLLQNLSPGKVFASVLESAEFLRKLPSRLNKVLETIAQNEFRITMFDEMRMMRSLEKIANRITLGLVLAALIIGAAMMMRVPSSFTILGHPGVAMLMLILAGACALVLALAVFWNDEKPRRRGATRRP